MTIEDIAKQQTAILGSEMMDLMQAATEAEELYSLDELEEYANEYRKENR